MRNFHELAPRITRGANSPKDPSPIRMASVSTEPLNPALRRMQRVTGPVVAVGLASTLLSGDMASTAHAQESQPQDNVQMYEGPDRSVEASLASIGVTVEPSQTDEAPSNEGDITDPQPKEVMQVELETVEVSGVSVAPDPDSSAQIQAQIPIPAPIVGPLPEVSLPSIQPPRVEEPPTIRPIIQFSPQPANAVYEKEKNYGAEWLSQTFEAASQLHHPRIDWAIQKFNSKSQNPRILTTALFLSTSLASRQASEQPSERFIPLGIKVEVPPSRPDLIQISRNLAYDAIIQPYNDPRGIYAILYTTVYSMERQQMNEDLAASMLQAGKDPSTIVNELNRLAGEISISSDRALLDAYRDVRAKNPSMQDPFLDRKL